MSTPKSGPDSSAPSIHTTPLPPPAPWYVPFLGLLSVLFGPSIIALNWWLVTPSIKRLEDLGARPASTTTLWVSISSLSVVGAVCVLSGIGLLLQQKWGRWMSFVFLGVAFVGLLIAGCATKISANLAELEISENGGNFVGPVYIQYIGGVPAFAPLYGLVLVVVLNLSRARSWARGGKPDDRYVPAPVAEGATGPQPSNYVPTQLSTLALLSFVISMVPFMLLTQCAALVMGIMALRRIKHSQGRLTGRGFAIAGICISSAILFFIGSIIALALSFYAIR